MQGKISLPNVTLIAFDCYDLTKIKAAADICQKYVDFGAVKLLSSIEDPDPRVVKAPEIKYSWQKYSEFLISDLGKYVDTEFAMHFHPDGFILNPEAWTDDFLKYDWIGAPWHHFGKPIVGAGGLSIRSKRLLDYISKHYKEIGGVFHPEDSWTCRIARDHLEKAGFTWAPVELAEKFAIEGSGRGVVWTNQFGWHGDKYTDISPWLEKNPEYKKLFSQKFDEFTEFMRKHHPVYDGTFHTFQTKPIQVENYKKLFSKEKNYDCRMHNDIVHFDEVKPRDNIIYKLFRISLEKVGVPTFERTVKKVEIFPNKKSLLQKHPHIQITNSFYLPKWKQRLVKIFGNLVFPNKKSYTVYWFE